MAWALRVQTPYLSEAEIERNVQSVREEHMGVRVDELEARRHEDSDPVAADASVLDELYGEAKAIGLEAGQVSTSYLQLKFGIDYARAARLVDLLEQGGVVGPADGARSRKVIGKDKAKAELDALAGGPRPWRAAIVREFELRRAKTGFAMWG